MADLQTEKALKPYDASASQKTLTEAQKDLAIVQTAQACASLAQASDVVKLPPLCNKYLKEEFLQKEAAKAKTKAAKE